MEKHSCRECGHSEDDHKWYGQSEEYDGEERWECRHSDDETHCDCIVTWSDSPFSDGVTQESPGRVGATCGNTALITSR
jgi:hypothetical protein